VKVLRMAWMEHDARTVEVGASETADGGVTLVVVGRSGYTATADLDAHERVLLARFLDPEGYAGGMAHGAEGTHEL
jgi:hypothetical protein